MFGFKAGICQNITPKLGVVIVKKFIFVKKNPQMAKNTFSRYLWLIGILKENSDGLTLEEIKKLWLESNLNPKGEPLPDRTFLNHVKAIREMFGYNIEYVRSLFYDRHAKGAGHGTWQIYDMETEKIDPEWRKLALARSSAIGRIEKIRIKDFGGENNFWSYTTIYGKEFLEDNSCIFTVLADTSDPDLIRVLLSRGEDIEVLSPQSLIDSLCTQAENILKRYGR
ncbi:MAG: hypothetical protein IK045_04665 [Bacteroidales bacterium]|nr:hypothetical protein [Bacteroidales bacterium]MBR6002136.1 hypothetical protein [Bacteroidales bacterium]